MKVYATRRFMSLYKRLPTDIQKRADNKLRILLQNPQHPSLRLHRVKGHKEMWEISVTRHYRILFRINGDKYILDRIGPHDILRKP